MKKFALMFVVASLMGWSGLAFADLEGSTACPVGQKLKLVGAIKTGSTQIGNAATADGGTISNRGVEARLIVVNCGGTACVVGIADVTQIGAAAAGDYRIEPGAPANTTLVIDLTKTPLYFSTGVSVGDNAANTNNVSVYACQ